ncbi:MAG: CapA family protein [Clostridia bacterium]|nr:CapA family protein [Clostridia bacterium]
MKKILAIFLTVILLTSCGEKKSETGGEPITEPKIEKVSFLGCGDNITYQGNIKDALSEALPGGRKYNFKPVFENVMPFVKAADIAFINQETVMCGEGYELGFYPRFNSPQDLGHDLVELGFDVIGIANNHMLDMGADGLEQTIKFWKNQDALMIGGYENEEDYNTIRVLEKNGIKIAFLSYTYGTNGLSKAASSSVAIPYIKDEVIKKHIESAKSVSDFIMVSIHWGNEDWFNYTDEQQRIAQLIADAGADAIIGHHPHVIQPIEWLTGVNGNKTLCVYSLGNFAAEQAYQYNMVGGMIKFDIVQVDDGDACLENVVFEPTVFHYNANLMSNTVYPMSQYTPELAARHGVRTFFGNSLNLDTLHQYVYDTISPEFLPEEFKE